MRNKGALQIMPSDSGHPTSFKLGRIAAALDGLAWQPIHTRITLVLGLGWMLDAFEVNIVGNVLGVLQRLWHVTAGQASLIVSVTDLSEPG